MMRQPRFALILLLSLTIGACSPPYTPPEPGDGCPVGNRIKNRGSIQSIDLEDFFLLHQSGRLLLIDARHPWFYGQGHIPEAISLPADERMDEAIQGLQPKMLEACGKGHPIIVYCDGPLCHASRTVCRAIAGKGFDVVKFGGGWKAWKNLGLPAESASQVRADL